MILKYVNLGHDKLEDYKKKKLEIKVFKPKEFDKYKEAMEQEEKRVVVIRNTKLKELDDDSDEVKDGEYLEIGERKFKLIKERGRVAVAYIPIDELTFVRIESNLFLFLILFGALLGGFILLTQIPFGGKPVVPLPDIEMDSDAGDWDGEGNKTGEDSVASQENTIIPGFSTFKATKEACLIKLYNFPENTVNFVYTITKPITKEAVETFDNIDEAQKYVTENTENYTNYYDEATNNYQLKDKNGNPTDIMIEYKSVTEGDKYVVYKHESEIVFFTKGIAPNKSFDWNAYETLGVGVHNVQFRISTFDVESNAACYGAVQDVVITILE